ncbi:MAG: NAD(P)H-binding protein [Candidatus Devosia symbiotica]|nr:NAD(P)H-binding protein [Candidatus Devosia symbiotica]
MKELLARGATKVVAGTRDPAKLADLPAKGVEVRPFNFDDAASLATTFAGVDRMLIISTDGIDHTARRSPPPR